MIVDAWMQHPTERFVPHPWLASLIRWKRHDYAGIWLLATTLVAMVEGGVKLGLVSAWVGPMVNW
jgi:hypothetical protein